MRPCTSVRRKSRPLERNVSRSWSRPKQVQDRRVQIVHRADVLHRVDAQLVGRADERAPLGAAAGQPDGEALGMMVAAVAACRVRRAAEFARPHNQCFVEQAASFEIFDESGDRPVGVEGVFLVPLLQIAVLVPRAVGGTGRAGDLDEPHSRLDQPPGPQALNAIQPLRGNLRVDAVERVRRGRFAGQVEHVRHERLHGERHFVVLDRRFDRVVAAERPGKRRVLLAQQGQLGPLDPRVLVAGHDVVDWRAVGREERRLLARGQKAAGVVFQAAARGPRRS